MSGSCVYLVTVNGADVPVEAANQAQAIRIATRPLVTGCRPLKGNEVLELYKAGTPVLTAKGQIGGAEESANFTEQREEDILAAPTADGTEGQTACMDPADGERVTHEWKDGAWVWVGSPAEFAEVEDASEPGAGEVGEIPLKGARRGKAAE
jgi:hypothetical protein